MKIILIIMMVLSSIGLASAEYSVGTKIRGINASHQSGNLEIAMVYPAKQARGKRVLLGENAVFYGTTIDIEAKPLAGKYPVLLLSHGWGGNFLRMMWLNKALAEKGANVISVNHPGTTTFDFDYNRALNHWTRVQDLSAVLDYAMGASPLTKHIDQDRIYVAGFSYGGATALSMVGLKITRDGLDKYCNKKGSRTLFCQELDENDVDISKLDAMKYNATYKDQRITSIAAIDPGMTWGLNSSNVAAIDVPVMLIGLGEGKDRLNPTDTSITGSNFEALLPNAKVKVIAPAQHFTMLGICKPEAEAILIEENDDPVCTDPTGTDRAAVLSSIVKSLSEHFKLK